MMGAYSFRYWSSSTAGKSVVLVHGFTGNAESWGEIAPRLGAKRTIVSVDLPGHDGATPHSSEEGGFEGAVDRLALALKNARLYGSHVVGYSLGGRVCLGLLVRYPNLVRGGTLIGVNPGIRTKSERRARAKDDCEWIALLEREGIGPFVDKWETLPVFSSQRALSKDLLDRQRSIRLGHNAAALAASLRALGLSAMPNYWPNLPDLTLPVHLIVGENDDKFVGIARRMVTLLPNGTLETISRSGHNLLLESPKSVADAILAHCDRKERISS